MRVERAATAGVAIARAVATGEPWVELMLHEALELVEIDAGAGLVRWGPTTNGGVPVVTVGQGPQWTPDDVAAAASVVWRHPSFAPGPPQVHRVSDRVDRMRDFRASDVYGAMHARSGGRFPVSVPLVLAPGDLQHLGLGRWTADVSDADVEALEILARPVRAALAFRAALDEAAAHLPLEPPQSDERFTSKEVDVLVLVAAGWTDGRIARRLGISEATVRQRLATARDRVGAVNRTHLVVRWLEVTGRVPADRATRAGRGEVV